MLQLAACGILAFYTVLMGWTGRTLLHAAMTDLPQTIGDAERFFDAISRGGGALLGQLISLVLTALVVARGVRHGIERLSPWVMPLLFALIVVLAIWAPTLPDAAGGYREFLLRWDASKLLDPSTIRNAFNQAFFSIGTGVGCILAYAAYLDRRSPLPREAVVVVAMDTTVGLMAGLVTFPVVMSFGLGDLVSSSTVGTLFIALPTGLASLGEGGRWVAVAFFSLAYMAAITSSVSLLEVPAASLIDRLGWTRSRAVWISTAAVFVAGAPSAINTTVLGRMDAVFGGVMLIAGGLALALLMGWTNPGRFMSDLDGSQTPAGLRRWLLVVLRWLSPPCIALGLVFSLVDLVRDWG